MNLNIIIFVLAISAILPLSICSANQYKVVRKYELPNVVTCSELRKEDNENRFITPEFRLSVCQLYFSQTIDDLGVSKLA